MVSNTNNAVLNPRTTQLEWNGVPGAFFTVLLLPCVVLLINTLCSGPATGTNSCSVNWFFKAGTTGSFSTNIQLWYNGASSEVSRALPDVPASMAILLAWYAFHCIFYVAWPLGPRGEGMPLRNGKTLKYNFSAFWSFWVSVAIAAAGHFYFNWWNWGALSERYMSLAIASIILSFLFSVMLYAASFRAGDDVLLAVGGNSGNPIYDFWVGRELNPRFGDLDFKFMFELRPGLIGWVLIAWGFVIRSAETDGKGNYLNNLPLLFAAVGNTIYVLDGLWFESGNVTMMDIVYDGFGFMLCFGDLAWVPFLYALQCKFLYMYPSVALALPKWYLAIAVSVYIAGYAIFRGANGQKDRFRKDPSDPSVKHLKVMKTSQNKSLIISGFWGVCRHPNYVGDWLMVVATSMFCGVGHLLPFFQVIYFAILLIHRQIRDEEWMLQKYGQADWDKYCKHVPWRLIPYVY